MLSVIFVQTMNAKKGLLKEICIRTNLQTKETLLQLALEKDIQNVNTVLIPNMVNIETNTILLI